LITRPFKNNNQQYYKNKPNRKNTHYDKYRRFRVRPFRVLFRRFKARKINFNSTEVKLWKHNPAFFFFTRSNFLKQTLPLFFNKFETITNSIFWLKTLLFKNVNSIHCTSFFDGNFHFYLRYCALHFKFFFILSRSYPQKLSKFWIISKSLDSKKKYLDFFFKNSFWNLKCVEPIFNIFKKFNDSSVLFSSSNYEYLLFSRAKSFLLTDKHRFISKNLPFYIKKKISPLKLNSIMSKRYEISRIRTFWSSLFCIRTFEIKKKLAPFAAEFRQKNNLPSRLYPTALFMITRLYKKQSVRLNNMKNSNTTFYFYIFDSYDFYHDDVVEITPFLKNWNSADVPSNFLDEIFYAVFIGHIRFCSPKFPIASVKTSYNINNAFFENKYSVLLKTNYPRLKRFFTRLKQSFLLTRKPIAHKKKKPRRKFFMKWKPLRRRKIKKIIVKKPIVKLINKYKVKPRKSTKNLLLNQKLATPYYLLAAKNILYNASSTRHIANLFSQPLLFKFFLSTLLNFISIYKLSFFLINKINNSLRTIIFYDRIDTLPLLNLSPYPTFFHLIEKRLLRIVSTIKFRPNTTPWHFNTMVRFFEFCTGKKVVIRLFSFISNILTFDEKSRCLIWSYRAKEFKKKLGTALFLNESLQVIYLALKLKDPYFLSDWLTKMFQKISFWKFRTLFRYVKYALRHFFFAHFAELNVKGVKLQLSGKISSAGNSRTRTIRYKIGQTGNSTLNNKTLVVLSCISTFTGVQGFKIWFTF